VSAERYDLPVPARAGGSAGWAVSSYALNAYRSLAACAGTDLFTVLAHARNDTLAAVVERRSVRSRSRLRPGRDGWGTRDPEVMLSVLSFKRNPPR